METLACFPAFVRNENVNGENICDFCKLHFSTRAERNDHIMEHFKRKSCSDCSKILIRIADDWYEIHTDVNCNKVKSESESESDFNAVDKFEEIILKSERDYLIANDEQINSIPNDHFIQSNELNTNIDAVPMDEDVNMNSPVCNDETIVKAPEENVALSKKQPRKKRNLKNYKKDVRIECQVCHEFIAKRKLMIHMQSLHVPKVIVPKIPFDCDKCDKSFDYAYKLKKHQVIHSETKRFICSYCGCGFSHKHNLQMHTNIHTGEKPYRCNVCQKSFGRDTQLRAHKRIHTGEKPYKCQIDGCERAYAYDIDLKRHKYSIHGIYTKKHICPICSKVYSENKLLKKHLESHSG